MKISEIIKNQPLREDEVISAYKIKKNEVILYTPVEVDDIDDNGCTFYYKENTKSYIIKTNEEVEDDLKWEFRRLY